METDIHRGEVMRRRTGRKRSWDWTDAALCRGIPRVAGRHQAPTRAGRDLFWGL